MIFDQPTLIAIAFLAAVGIYMYFNAQKNLGKRPARGPKPRSKSPQSVDSDSRVSETIWLEPGEGRMTRKQVQRMVDRVNHQAQEIENQRLDESLVEAISKPTSDQPRRPRRDQSSRDQPSSINNGLPS